MPKQDFFQEFYGEAMTEMARSFFSRRKEAEARLEGFRAMVAQVEGVGRRVRRRLAAFYALVGDDARAAAFLDRASGAQFPPLVPAQGTRPEPWPLATPFALTFAGRHQKALVLAYQTLEQAARDYREGAYGPDPADARRKVLLPNLESLRGLAQTINAEVEAVNTAQTPTTVLAYAKSLDPVAAGRESVTGGLTGLDVGKLDRDLAFAPIDFDALGLPDFPPLPPADALDRQLEDLGEDVRKRRSRSELERVLASLALVER